MKFVIKYWDGAYEYHIGSGHPCDLSEARRFNCREDAEKHAENLFENTIEEIEE